MNFIIVNNRDNKPLDLRQRHRSVSSAEAESISSNLTTGTTFQMSVETGVF